MTVLLYVFIPFLIGSIHWLLHNLSGQLTERKKYERKRVFGAVLSIVVIAGICFWVGLAAEADTKAAGGIAGRQTVMAGIAAAAGWRYIKCIWTPFEGNSGTERDELIRDSSVKRDLARNIEQSNQMSQKVNELLGKIKDPTIAGMVSGFVPKKPVENKKEQETKGEFEFNKTARMFVPKGDRTAKSNEESAPKEESSIPTAKLQELKAAFDQGLIDAEEYSALKKQLLGL